MWDLISTEMSIKLWASEPSLSMAMLLWVDAISTIKFTGE